MDTVSFLTLLATLMKQNPPYAEDAPVLARFQRIGLVPARTSTLRKSRLHRASRTCPSWRSSGSQGHFQSGGEDLNGWVFFKPGGRYGPTTSSVRLSRVSGLAAISTEDAVYPSTVTDAVGRQAGWREQVCHAVPEGADATSARLLVADDVQRAILLRRQPAEPLHAECAQRTEGRSRRHD